METNIINNLTTRMMNCYDECKKACNTFANVGLYAGARTTVVYYTNRAYGAMEFAMMLCHENGYPDTANEIMTKWNTVWSIWFNELLNDYNN